ncbi:hypothetical protein RRG08_046015 [Elysia crispata]|uniref:Uncharacterized protein n=1 Tax=Elysia crispata TaxID=231223 RepID=A0AAE0ZC47_9GAST|nr:hypothetical protein RRG08_046015 [Elysia crispata]
MSDLCSQTSLPRLPGRCTQTDSLHRKGYKNGESVLFDLELLNDTEIGELLSAGDPCRQHGVMSSYTVCSWCDLDTS